ncbi:MAG TPA: S-layer homology domain-containing protein, partial [Thermoleophilia bacterium]
QFYAPITALADKGVVSGYDNGNFGPNDLVTRQQFAKMIIRAVGYPVSTADQCGFGDVYQSYSGHYVDPHDPLYPDHYVAVAAMHHVTDGETQSTFGPTHNIKLAQVTTMVVRAGDDQGVYTPSIPHAYTPPFDDFGPPHYVYARFGAFFGLFQGYPGPWNWFSAATRGQCAFFIWRLMTTIEGAGGH